MWCVGACVRARAYVIYYFSLHISINGCVNARRFVAFLFLLLIFMKRIKIERERRRSNRHVARPINSFFLFFNGKIRVRVYVGTYTATLFQNDWFQPNTYQWILSFIFSYRIIPIVSIVKWFFPLYFRRLFIEEERYLLITKLSRIKIEWDTGETYTDTYAYIMGTGIYIGLLTNDPRSLKRRWGPLDSTLSHRRQITVTELLSRCVS